VPSSIAREIEPLPEEGRHFERKYSNNTNWRKGGNIRERRRLTGALSRLRKKLQAQSTCSGEHCLDLKLSTQGKGDYEAALSREKEEGKKIETDLPKIQTRTPIPRKKYVKSKLLR